MDSQIIEKSREYIERMRSAPRLTSLHSRFESIVIGESGRPHTEVVLNQELLGYDYRALTFAKTRDNCAGLFNAHFVASLPYVLEEQCRSGAALLLYSLEKSRQGTTPLKVYTLGDASGVMARSLTEISNGKIHTLTCSPSEQNRTTFFSSNPRPEAHFFCGAFFDVSPERLEKDGLPTFSKGFDVLIEDTTFQMYGAERIEPIYLASRNLKSDGIFVVLEKIKNEDVKEYNLREYQKDYGFKSRFFSRAQIEQKQSEILETMRFQEATLKELSGALRQFFKAAVIVWNSGNFYTIAASNSLENLKLYAQSLIPPAIPSDFIYEALPCVLFGDFDSTLHFRLPEEDGDSSQFMAEVGG